MAQTNDVTLIHSASLPLDLSNPLAVPCRFPGCSGAMSLFPAPFFSAEVDF